MTCVLYMLIAWVLGLATGAAFVYLTMHGDRNDT